MKKVIFLVGALFVMVSCSSNRVKSPEDVYKKLKDAGYNMIYSYRLNSDRNYDEEGNCFDHSKSKIACDTDILFEDEKPQIGLSIESKDEELQFSYSAFNSVGIMGISYEKNGNAISYFMDKKNNHEMITLVEESKSCSIVNKNENDIVKKLNVCNDDKKETIERLESSMNKSLKALGLTKDELYMFMKWYEETYIMTNFNNAKLKSNSVNLTASEVQNIIESLDFVIVRETNSVKLEKDIESILVEGLDEDMIQIQYRTAKESSVYVTYRLDSNELYGYSGHCIFDLYAEKDLGKSNCNKEDIMSIRVACDEFYESLRRMKINFLELVNWSKNNTID